MTVAQVAVNDAFADFRADGRVDRPPGEPGPTIAYPWVEGEAYEVLLLTSTGATITHEIPAPPPLPRRPTATSSR